ncbi:bacterial low temperature requirement A protein-domain-containing protein [Xylariales sp. PMI_506]|nr:bacterial low temperature requirement A protein-domain-containing protein [Xylariales sp. PMI_506]
MSETPKRVRHASVASAPPGLSSSAAPSISGSRRRRPQEFMLPSGVKILVALPEEAARLRDKYAHRANDPDAVQVEIVVHGSKEHSDHLRALQQHHSDLREELRRKHGPDFEQWEKTRGELDEVCRQLEGLSDHGAQEALNANFEKFGYMSVLRTYGEAKEGGSSATSIAGDDDESSITTRDWDDNRGGKTMKLFQRPVIKQYFHRGLLWRASELTEIMSFELFFDLLYVGILDINGETASENPTGAELLRFVVTFVMSWKIWSDVQLAVSWFETNDLMQRLQVIFLFACLLGFTTNMVHTFSEEYDTYIQLVSFYLAARLFQAAYFALTAFLLPMIVGVMIGQIVTILIPAVLWMASTHVEMPQRLGLIFVALALDIFGGSAIVALFRYSRSRNTPLARRIEKLFEFYPAINIEHKVERTNAFVSLVIGYGIVALLYQNAGWGINAFLGKAIIGLMQSFIFNWLYFDIDGDNIHVHAIRRRVDTAWIWQLGHLPFICAYILASAAMSKLVLATDTPNTDAHLLTELYEERSEPEISLGLRFFYCIGFGIALFFMGVISATHVHKNPENCHIPKKWRLVNRAVVCAIFCCLPAAHDLDSLQLMSITLGLMVWVLAVEVWGVSCSGDSFFGGGRSECTYSAKCSKSRLARAMRPGDDDDVERRSVDVVELSRGEKTAVDLQG